MRKRLHIQYDPDLIERISSDFDLRAPNKEAFRKIIFSLEGDYDPDVMQVVNLATGVGKTYLMAAIIEYFRCQGIYNVVIVTPGKVVQSKTIQNFTQGSTRYIPGARVSPDVVTPQNYSAWVSLRNTGMISYGSEKPVLAFIFNIQQLIAPKTEEGSTRGHTDDEIRRKPRRFDEAAGELFAYLKGLDNLVVIADESHLYSTSAVAFHAALEELNPAASIGLTASVLPGDHVIHSYKLYEAIRDKYVKAPVLAFRREGYGEDVASEEQQLRDALQLRNIKQAYYDAYAQQNGMLSINAVLFVVCADVEHATQITALLSSPEYFGNVMSVLQVDSKHDDDVTQQLLENIDQPGSPVLAVVSVNKLKEGWDVKNIAVVVTLRAMASEVLTQQTMGRGLRLPFGKHTGVWQIDQLDIIAHQSFEELLAAENILNQFGLEDATSEENRERANEAVRRAAAAAAHAANQVDDNTDDTASSDSDGASAGNSTPLNEPDANNPDEHNESDPIFPPGISPVQAGSGSPTIGIRPMDNSTSNTVNLQPVFIHRNPRFADVSYQFPVTTIELRQPPIDLSEITEQTLKDAAQRVTSTGDTLYRKEIVAALGQRIRVVDAESAEVDSIHVDDADAKTALVKIVCRMQMVPSTLNVIQYVKEYLVPVFMNNVRFEGWTVKSLGSAREQLQQVIKSHIDTVLRATREIPKITPKTIDFPDYPLPIGERVYDPIDRQSEFVRGRTYSGWFKSLYEAESFDSYTGEYQLARLLNISPNIVWWHRLHFSNGAYVYYTSRDRYFPDFVALDRNGVHWIIEGKDKRGRDNDIVQAKRLAAESLVRRLAAEPIYSGQHWGYMIAYEDDIERSDSWDDLKALAQPVSNAL